MVMIWDTIWLENAELSDAKSIAEMSRDQIEAGLEWSWTEERVSRSIRKHNSKVLKASIRTRFVGFGIMTYEEEKANLNLLASDPAFRRKGVGKKILESLEKNAVESGIENFYVQVREKNIEAQRFYNKFGYEMIDRNEKYYKKKESGVILYKYCPINRHGI